MKHRGSRKKHHTTSLRLWIARLVALLVLVLIGWWSITAFMSVNAKIKPYANNGSHAFISSSTQNPVLLVIQQSQSAEQLQSLAVVRLNHDQHGMSILQLPTDLSDGKTTAAEYLQSGYYKELQQMVEQTLALPINGYLIQPVEAKMSVSGQAWSALMTRQVKLSWWSTTVASPWWLGDQPDIRTNLSTWQLLQAIWLARDADDSRIDGQTVPAEVFSRNEDGKLIADITQLDPIVTDVLVEQKSIDEGVSVVVKNATEVSGLAALAARYVHHLGGEVVAIEPADSGQPNTSMKAENDSRLSDGVTVLLGVPLTIAPKTGRERADVELIVGIDVLSRLGKPQ